METPARHRRLRSLRRAAQPLLESLENRALMTAVAVTSLADSGAGSLRAAIGAAASGDTIEFGNLQGTVTLASTLDFSGKDLTVVGSGRKKLTIDAHSTTRAMTSSGTNSVTITDMKIVGGNGQIAGLSGSVFALTGSYGTPTIGTLTMTNVDATGGRAANLGGAVATIFGNFVGTNCNFWDNQVTSEEALGGAIGVSQGGNNAFDQFVLEQYCHRHK